MASASDQLARLLALLPWLRAHPEVGKAEAAAAFGISVGQLENDLRLAFTCELPGRPEVFIDIDYLDRDRITVRDAQTIDRPLRLRPDEALALLVGLRALAAVPGLQDRAALDSVLAKLEDAAGAGAAVAEAASGEQVPTPDAGVTAAVREALGSGRRLHLSYWVPTRDEVTERDVDPLRVVTTEGTGYLEGWCHLSEAVRTFRLDRVLAAQVLEAASAPPPGATPQGDAGSFHPSPDDTVVTLALDASARWVPEYYPCESVSDAADGGLRVTLRTADPRWVGRLVLRLGGAAHVLSPPGLAGQVDDLARTALAAYGQ